MDGQTDRLTDSICRAYYIVWSKIKSDVSLLILNITKALNWSY